MQIKKASWHFDLSSGCVLKLQLKYLWECVSCLPLKTKFLFLKHLNWNSHLNADYVKLNAHLLPTCVEVIFHCRTQASRQRLCLTLFIFKNSSILLSVHVESRSEFKRVFLSENMSTQWPTDKNGDMKPTDVYNNMATWQL